MTIPNLQRSLLDPSAVRAENYQVMAQEYGVAHLVTAAKTEAAALKLIDSMLPKPEYFESNLEGAKVTANAIFDLGAIGEGSSNPRDTQKQFIKNHTEGKTVQIISDNLKKLADGAEKEYFSGFTGAFRKFASLFHTSDTMKEIQGLRSLAARNLKEIQQ